MKTISALVVLSLTASVVWAQAKPNAAQKEQKPIKVSVADLLKSRDAHDQKGLIVEGKVAKFEQRTSKKGNPYVVFDITDGKSSVHIYGQGKLETKVKDGDKVRVTGFYRKEKKFGDRVYKDEIQINVKKKSVEVL